VAKVTVWLKELRTEFLTASVVPVLLSTAVSRYETGAFDPLLFALTLAGIVFLHLGTNVANDYFDHLSKNDILNVRYVRPFTGGSRLIQEGLISPRTVLVTSISFFIAALVIGIILTVMRGPLVLAFGLAGLISGFFYTAPPLYFAHRGIGEFLVGINFGLLTVIATYYVQTGSISSGCIVASLPLTFLIASVIIINEFQDSEADARRAVILYAVVSLLGYLPILLGTATGLLPPLTLIGMATLPLIVKAIITARLYYNESKKLVPANASTILSHMLTGLLIAAGYIISIGG